MLDVQNMNKLFESCKDKKILITGGTGFVGRSLLNYLNRLHLEGWYIPDVVVLSRNPQLFLSKYQKYKGCSWLSFIQGDVLSIFSNTPEEFFCVIHAAADSTPEPQMSSLCRFDQILNGTRNVLDFALKCNTKKFLFISSGAVYGSQPFYLDKIPEDFNSSPDILDSQSAYGVAKRSAEHLSILYQNIYGINIVIARCFAFVGDELPLNSHFAIGNFISDAIRSKPITIVGDGSSIRSYLDQRDLAHWLFTLLLVGKPGKAYNVGSDISISIKELAELVRSLINPKLEVKLLNSDKFKFKNSRYVPDIKNAYIDCDLKVNISLETAIVDFYNSKKNNDET